MAVLGWITVGERAEAVESPIELRRGVGKKPKVREPYFVQFIKGQILDTDNHEFDFMGTTYQARKEALFQGGLKIHTTISPQWQKLAQEAIRGNLSEASDPEGAMATVETKTGAIRTLVSGTDFVRDELELAAGQGRQTGSAAKPFTLVAAFRQGVPAGKVYRDKSPLCGSEIPGWRSASGCVYNAEGGGSDDGYRDLWSATQYSVNVVFAQLALDIGPESIVDAAQDMGITTPLDAVPAITLGSEEATPLDMASAYGTLANSGVHCDPFAVQRIEHGRQVLYKHKAKPNCQQVVDAPIAHQVTAMLERSACCGTGGRAWQTIRPMAGKTGTSPDYTNAWFVGYTRYLSTAVWVGHVKGLVPMKYDYYGGPVFGGTFPAAIWHDFMVQVVDSFPFEDFPAPPPPEYGTIPDVLGLLEEEAAETLAEANFTPIVEEIKGAEPVG
ncbi:MAG: hypothetical protein HY658_10055, partial [Actinobacteria bacterium]|nr:hypothetical protein [Actinomycetota bacterium]